MKYLLRSLLLAGCYYGAARLGLRLASVGDSISLVWPPTGIAFAALVALGYRYWPAIAVGALLANLATPVPWMTAVGISVGNTLEAVTATFLFRRLAGPVVQLEAIRQVRALVLVAAPLAALVSAVIGVASLVTTGVLPAVRAPFAAATWWAGDLLGALVVAPFLLSWFIPAHRAKGSRRLFEIAVLCLGTALAAEWALGRVIPLELPGQLHYPILLFPFVIWAALRFGVRGATIMTLVVCVVAVWHTVQGGGPFIRRSPEATLIAIASYLIVVAVTGLVLASVVVWEREKATEALAQSEARLRRSLDAARMGTWAWTVEGNGLTWDDNLRQLYGLKPHEQVTGYQDFMARVHPDDRDFVGEAVRRSLEQGGELNYEFRIVLPDGRVRWIADQGEVIRDAAGAPVCLTGVCMDVTDRRMAEERMRQAHRMESVGRLAGGVAHETNNQMSIVLGASSFILARKDLPEPVRSDAELIQRAAERTSQVTAQLLAFSRRQMMSTQVFDLNAVIRGWEPVLRRIMGEDCEVSYDLAPDLGAIRADPGQIQQALLNLAINARDAMPLGGRLTIESRMVELSPEYARKKDGASIRLGRYVMLAVSDTGHGMDGHTRDHMFEPFFTTKGIGHGTGLGLSTVYGIVKQSEGYVWVYSEPGQGATFKLYFPLCDEPPELAVAVGRADGKARGERILVVEDEDGVRRVTSRALTGAGFSVLEAESGRHALDLVSRSDQPISLVLTDVVMPGLNGPELAGKIAEIAPGIPVVYTSGYTDGEIARRGLLEPGATFIQKPFSPDAIVRIVRELLDGSRRPGVTL